jgi:hypothetical protein
LTDGNKLEYRTAIKIFIPFFVLEKQKQELLNNLVNQKKINLLRDHGSPVDAQSG